MRLGWDEIKRRAKAFSEEHTDKTDERADSQLFLNDFFKIFGMSSRQIGRYERRVANVSLKQRGFIDFFWPGQLLVEMKSRGKDLVAAEKQALDYIDGVHPTSSLADLYDPDTMPGNLRKAHSALDTAVDRLYRPATFASDRDRVEHLFGRYEALVNPLERVGIAKNKRVAKKAGKA